MLVGGTLLSTTYVVAAPPSGTTRHLYVGSKPDFADPNGALLFTPVSTNSAAGLTVYVKSLDNQNLTHVVVTFPQSQGPVTIGDTAFGTDSAFCAPVQVTDPLTGAVSSVMTCDFGNMKAHSLRTFILVLSAPGATGTYAINGKVVFNESNNPQGGNDQINLLSGSMVVTLTTCDVVATFLPPGHTDDVQPPTTCPTGIQLSKLKFVKNLGGIAASVDDSNPTAPADCPVGYTCFGEEVVANVNNDATILPYLIWEITYSSDAMKGINPKNVAFQHGIDVLTAKKNTCGATFANKDCIVGYLPNADGSITFTIWTTKNSTIRGLH